MARALAALIAVAACARPAPPATPAPANPPTVAAAPTALEPGAPTELDGLVVWPGPLADAPPAVAVRYQLARDAAAVLASAPEPTPAERSGAAWHELQARTQAHVAGYQAAVTAYLAGPHRPDVLAAQVPPEAARRFLFLVGLAELWAQAQYVAARYDGPLSVGSCDGGPAESYADILGDVRDQARRCHAQLVDAGPPWTTTARECLRRAAWAEAQLARAEPGVCEVEVPER